MNSKNLRVLGFHEWFEFSIKNADRLLHWLPREKGVYVIRYKNHFGRFKGKSDIMYLGSSVEENDGLRRRIRFFFKPGKSQKTSKRINKWLRTIQGFEISYITVSKGKKAREIEAKLREEYGRRHGEFPPWNRNA